MKRFYVLFGIVVLGMLMAQCRFDSQQEQTEPVDKKEIRLIYPDWTEGIAMTHLIKVILRDRLHYNVTTRMDEVNDIYAMVASGEYDVFADAWLPKTHERYWNLYSDSLMDLGIVFEDARTGIVAPDFMSIKNISDINQLETSERVVYGLDTVSGVMQATKQAFEHYQVDGQLVTGNEQELMDKFDLAYQKHEPILITGWVPHWMFGKYNLKFLNDPDAIYGANENIHIVARNGFEEDFPVVVRFLKNMLLTDAEMNALLTDYNANKDYPERGIIKWMEEHVATVNSWIHGLRVERMRSGADR